MTYKVELDVYNGPMDLLLYLIRREEVDIREVALARVADQYIAYLDALKSLDIELAGDFVVLAATLLEIKSRALLPRPPEEDETPDDEDQSDEDPRETLIRQLIEYRRFKDAASLLDDRGREMAWRFPRQFDEQAHMAPPPPAESSEDGPPSEFLQGVEIWDLISAFSQIVRTLGYNKPREVVYDDTPVEEASKALMARLEIQRSVLFTQLFKENRSPTYLVSMFLALLELIRQRRIGFEQQADFKDIRLFVRDPAAEPVIQQTPLGADESRDALERKGPRRPSARQREDVREMMDEVDFEKTEFDHILESVTIPDVEAFKPIYSENELLGKPDEGAAVPPAEAGADAAPVEDAPPDGEAPGGTSGASDAPPDEVGPTG